MGSGRENALADASAAGAEDLTVAIPQVSVPDDESDDEYEPIPSQRDKPKADPPARPSAAISQPAASRVSREEGQKGERDELEGGTASGDHENPESSDLDNEDVLQATDDDWLRSRTNRLLDLMDPNDLPPEPTRNTSSTQPPESTGDHPGPEELEETRQSAADDAAKDKTDVDKLAEDSTVESIRRTSRLFVRNLPYGATEDDIRECFEKFGTLQEVRLSVTFCFSSPLQGSNGFCDEPQIGTAYTSVYDVNLGEYFSRCFDCLRSHRNLELVLSHHGCIQSTDAQTGSSPGKQGRH